MIKLYVGNLPYSYKDQDIKQLFSAYGNIVSSTVIIDRQSGRSKGFGFVEIEDDSLAKQAVAEMNDKEIDGRKIKVNEARPMTDRPRGNNSY